MERNCLLAYLISKTQLNILTDRDLNMRILSKEAADFFSLSLYLFTMGTLHAT